MRFDKTTGVWKDTVDANTSGIEGGYTAFAPVGNPFPDDSKGAALIALSNSRIELFDPDTGAVIPSNIAASCQKAGPSATMPDWSPNGKTVAFASTPTPGQWIDIASSRLATMPYSFAAGAHTFGDPVFINLLARGVVWSAGQLK